MAPSHTHTHYLGINPERRTVHKPKATSCMRILSTALYGRTGLPTEQCESGVRAISRAHRSACVYIGIPTGIYGHSENLGYTRPSSSVIDPFAQRVGAPGYQTYVTETPLRKTQKEEGRGWIASKQGKGRALAASLAALTGNWVTGRCAVLLFSFLFLKVSFICFLVLLHLLYFRKRIAGDLRSGKGQVLCTLAKCCVWCILLRFFFQGAKLSA